MLTTIKVKQSIGLIQQEAITKTHKMDYTPVYAKYKM